MDWDDDKKLPDIDLAQPPAYDPGRVQPVAPIMMPVQRDSNRWSKTSTTSQKVVPEAGLEELATRAVGMEAREKEADLEAQKGAAIAQQHETDAQAHDERAANIAKREAEKSRVGADYDAQMAAQREQVRLAEIDAEANSEPKEFWGSMSTGNRILAAIGVALSGLGQMKMARGGVQSENMALKSIQKASDEWYGRERERILRMKEKVKLANGKVIDLSGQKEKALRDLDNKYVAIGEQAAAYHDAKQARAKVPQAEIEKNQLSAKLRADTAEKREALMAREREMGAVTSSTSKTSGGTRYRDNSPERKGSGKGDELTGPQADAAAILGTMAGNLEAIRKGAKLTSEDMAKVQDNQTRMNAAERSQGIAGAIFTPIARSAGIVPRVPTQGLPEEKVKTINEWNSFTGQVLKMLSGQGVTEGELQRTRQLLTPQPNDTPAMYDARIKFGERLLREAAIKAGPGAASIRQRAEGQQAPAPQLSGEDAAAVSWAKRNPDDPRAQEILRGVR